MGVGAVTLIAGVIAAWRHKRYPRARREKLQVQHVGRDERSIKHNRKVSRTGCTPFA